jgi:hypothetical protein
MKTHPVACVRLFEAEAMRDGRLSAAEMASFARHTAACSACRDEVRALDVLGEALRASSRDGGQADDLRRLRERTRLVAAFDATLVARRRRTARPLRPALWATAGAAMVAAAVLFARVRLTRDGGSAAGLVVHASAAAVWSKQSQGDRETVVLESGELWIQVDHARRNTRLVVALPDGELEDTGTTFTVNAANGRTTRVAVREGSVVLRITGKSPRTIGAGATWAPSAEESATAESPPASEPPRAAAPEVSPRVSPPSSSPGTLESDGAPRGRLRSRSPARPAAAAASPRPASIRAARPAPVGTAAATDPGIDFRAAVAVLDVGAHRQAAAAFARFLAEHPGDPRAEDAAYLQVIALQRLGSAEETRRAAQAYLRLFPKGFRRAELETLLR